MKGDPWTEKDKEFLRKNWKGHSAGILGQKLGRTRNAVMGMVHRLGLFQIPIKTVTAKKELSRANTGKKRGTIVSAEPAPIAPQDTHTIAQKWPTDGVPFLEATSGQCRAIIGSSDDSRGLVVFCGKPIVNGGTFSFCDEHLAEYTYPLKRG